MVTFCVAFLLAGCSERGKEFAMTPEETAALRRDVQAISSKRVFFGHQSVGANVLDGIRDLAKDAGVGSLNIQPADSILQNPSVSGGFLAEAVIGKNGNPDLKCEAFEKRLHQLAPLGIQIALMKFCYVDFVKETDVAAVFKRYDEAVTATQRAYPGIRIIHVTAPLTTRTPLWKRLIKTLVGKADDTDIELTRRAAYNDMLRGAYPPQSIFDLAGLESSDGRGGSVTFAYEGKAIPYMDDRYTTDGGHLNEPGRQIAALTLVRLLARAD
jgi:hypothetical protein